MRGYLKYLPKSIREKLILAQLALNDAELSELTVKVATTLDEHEQAGRIVHDAYLARGIIEPQRAGVWITAHGIMPWTVVFVAKKGETVIGTLSLVVDSKAGLPMDKIYEDELDALRATGNKLAEVGALCVTKGNRNRGVAFLLNKLMWRCAAELLLVDHLVISVHPDAACIYESTLRFVQIGGERHYPGLTDEGKAVALTLDLGTFEEVLIRDFAHMGTAPNSPYQLYFLRQDEELEMPRAAELLRSLEGVRSRAADHLGALRPECFADLNTPQRRAVRPVFPRFQDQLRSLPILLATSE